MASSVTSMSLSDRALPFVAATLIVATVGCDSVWTMNLTVQVPPDVQATVIDFPQEVRVRWGYRGAGFWFVDSLGVLCSAGAEPFDSDGDHALNSGDHQEEPC